MSKVANLRELLIDELQDLLSAENQLIKALPKMAEAATDPDLKAGFEEHLEQTRGHVTRLEEAFDALGEPAKMKTCKAMEGLVKEGDEAIKLEAPAAIHDACLIGAARRVEHYEIAAYSSAIAFAEVLGESTVVELLQQTLEEESETDDKLSSLADAVNEVAVSVGDEA